MILNRTCKFIFLKTLKTAGTSFEIALSKYAGPTDIITPISEQDENLRLKLGYRGPQNHLFAPGEIPNNGRRQRQGQKFYNHITAAELAVSLDRETFDRFYKVSIIRNPYDMVVSLYFWEHRNQQGLSREHFRKWLLSRPSSLVRNRSITHIEGRSVVDQVMRFDALEADIRKFSQAVGLPMALYEEFNSIRTKSHLRPKQASASFMFEDFSDGRALMEKTFQHEINLYKYSL